MPDLFMSYSRRDKEFVKKLVDALKAQNRDVWVDWEDIPLTADWMSEIHAGIETANNFIFIISPDSVASEVCGKEVEHAIQHNKRLVPVLRRDVTDYKQIHAALASHNWIYMRDTDDFDAAFVGLTKSLDTDLDYVKLHTRLLNAALEWEKKGKRRDLLLRGAALTEAEQWLATAANKTPAVTELQSQFVYQSRKEENARQRTMLGGVTAGLVISILLTIAAIYLSIVAEQNRREAEAAQQTAVYEKGRADLQSQVALARQLAAQGLVRLDDNLVQALLLSVEANQIGSAINLGGGDVRGALLDTLQYSPHIVLFVHGHARSVQRVALNPDGTLLASVGADMVVRLWDANTYQLLYEMTGHSDSIRSVAFSPDGTLLATVSNDKTVRLWDVARQTELAVLEGHTASVRGVAFSPDGTLLATSGEDNLIILWDLTTRTEAARLEKHTGLVRSLAFSPDGALLASGSFDNTIILWDVATRQPIGEPFTGHDGGVLALMFSPDGTLLASGGAHEASFGIYANTLLWRVTRGDTPDRTVMTRLRELTLQDLFVTGVTFSPDGQTLATTSADRTMVLWNLSDLNQISYNDTLLSGHANWVNNVVFSPDGQTMFTASDDSTIGVWSLTPMSIGTPLQGHNTDVLTVAYSPDGRWIASGGLDSVVRLWDADTLQPLGDPLAKHSDRVEFVTFSPDGSLLASSSNDNTIILWDTSTWQPVGDPLTGHQAGVLALAFSPDGTLLVSADVNGVLLLWDVATRAQVGELVGHAGWIKTVVFSPDGTLIASGGRDAVVHLWDVATRAQVGELKGHLRGIRSIAFTPDGTRLVSASRDETLIVWEVATRQMLGVPLEGHTDEVDAVAISPDGQLMASGSIDFARNVILWDFPTLQRIGRPLSGHLGPVRALAFSPDGTRLVSVSMDDYLIVWDIKLENWEVLACAIANTNLTSDEWALYVGDAHPYTDVCPTGQ